MVVMAFDEQGQADTGERKVSICQRAYRLLTEQVGFAPRTSSSIPTSSPSPPASRSTTTTRWTSSRRCARSSATCPGVARQRRRQQPVVLVPRQRRRPRGDARRLPVSRDPGRHGHGHRQRRPARGLRGDPRGAARRTSRTCCSTAVPTRPSGWSSSPIASRAPARSGRTITPGAISRWRRAWRTRWCTASSTSSRSTSRRRGRAGCGRSRSSKGR